MLIQRANLWRLCGGLKGLCANRHTPTHTHTLECRKDGNIKGHQEETKSKDINQTGHVKDGEEDSKGSRGDAEKKNN